MFLHLRDGRFWLETGLRVNLEPFAYTVPGMPFEKAEWLYRLGLYALYRAGGFNLLILLQAALGTLTIFLLGKLMLRRWRHAGAVAGLLALAVLAPLTRMFSVNPNAVTYLFLPLVLLRLEDYRETGGTVPRGDAGLWKLPVLTLAWANLHAGFLTLFVFLGAYLLDDGWHAWRQRDRAALHRVKTLSVVSVLIFLAGGVNPQGFGIYAHALNWLGFSAETILPGKGAVPALGEAPFFFILLALAWSAQLLNWSRMRLRDALPLLVFSYLALRAYHTLPLFFLAALPPLTQNLADLRAHFRPSAQREPRAQGAGWWLGGALALLILITAAGSGYAFRPGEIPRMFPQGALSWLEQHPLSGRLLTHDTWGGYAGWRTHGRLKIFLDNRFSPFNETLRDDYRKMFSGDPHECLPLLDRYSIQGVLVSPKNDLRFFQTLWGSHLWTLVYWDDVSLLYVRNSAANVKMLRDFAFVAVDPRHTPYFNPSLSDQALAEIRRAQTQAPDSFLPFFFEGDLALRKGNFPASRAALERSRTLAPAHPPTLLNLGILDRKENRLPQAEVRLRQVLNMPADTPVLGMAAFQLALLLSQEADAARRREAGQWAEKALLWMPGWEPALDLKQRLQTTK
ncbi:MAG: hypothetical protein HGA76_10280 [Candidatus Firestonebacteria bacterium]|nr:hypothetical protein [Candidatus Firestonebacteria bacterium]